MLHDQVIRLVAVAGISLATIGVGPAFAQEEPPTTVEAPPPPTILEPPPITIPEPPPITLPEPPLITVPQPPPPTAPPTSKATPPTDNGNNGNNGPKAPKPEVTVPPVTTAPPTVAPQVAPAAPEDPPGNNGTIKVDGTDFDSHQDNEPHVGCVFQIDFYGYDEGDLSASVTFEGQPPTGGGTLLTDSVDIGEDPAGGGGDLDASVTYDLSAALAGITPHPVQGHHVKLTIEAEGSQGAPVKHKVFWVEGCGGTTTTTTAPTTTTTAPTTTTTAPTTTTTAPTTTTEPPSTTTTEAPTTTTEPESTTSTEAPTTTEPPSTTTTTEKKEEGFLARTGSDILPIVGIGLGLLALGAGAVFLNRRTS